MKKITLLLLMAFYSLVGYSQDFEGLPFPNGLPPGWIVANNGVGLNQSWRLTNTPAPYVIGTQAMFINLEEIGQGNTSIDYLITSPIVVPSNGQLRFFAHSTLTGNNGSIYEVRYLVANPGNTNQGDTASYLLLEDYTEVEIGLTFEEKVVDLTPTVAAGTTIYLAFVRKHTQVGTAAGGDRLVVDNVSIVQKCFNPANLDVANVASTSVTLTWEYPPALGTSGNFEYVIVGATAPTPNPNDPGTDTGPGVSEPVGGLTADTEYKYYLRAECSPGIFSEWVGPFFFNTIPFGTVCSDPIQITTLPYETDANTGSFGNSILGPQGASCGATPNSTNYLSGNDVIYRLEIPTTTPVGSKISITLTPNGTRSSLFLYDECSNISGTCLAGVANTNGNPRVITNYVVTPGEDYYIVVSSNSTTPIVPIPYNLIIQYENCEKPTALGLNSPTLTGGNFTWTEAGTATAWEIAFQQAGENIPQGSGTPVATAGGYLDIPTNLQGQAAQYWVRAVCPIPGLYSAWAGPYVFNTLICAPADQCTYTIRMTDSANNGWNGARMQVRQNGIVIPVSPVATPPVTTVGGTYNSGAGPVDVTFSLCNGQPFDIFWLTAGTQPQQCIVSVLNSFGQTILTKPAGVGSPGEVVLSGTVNCITPQCNIAPTNVTVSSITTFGGVINWSAPGTENVGYNIYLVPTGQPAPSNGTDTASQGIFTYTGVNGPAGPFSFTIPATPALAADTTYDVYVRVLCAPFHSDWSPVSTFTTLPTCPKPINLGVSGITTTSATIAWTEAGTATQWDLLLLASGPGGEAPAAPGVVPVVNTAAGDLYFPGLTTTTYTPTLQPATIYFVYVRAVCGGNDPSSWTFLAPLPNIAGSFNTVTCAEADKCQYKFLLTDTGGNGWNGGRVQVRQNGIVVATLNLTSGAGPTTVNVNICKDEPFDLFWSIAGTAPAEIGFSIQNPFTDIIYTYAAGSGTPLTILYTDSEIGGNCTAPVCPKPTNLQVVSTTSDSALLSWTPGGTETQWEVYAVPTIALVPPSNTVPPVAATLAPYYLASTNTSFLVPALTSGTSYTYYVRAICSGTDYSTWTILNPRAFVTKPLNDECETPTVVPVNPTQICNQIVAGNTLGATASPQIATCPGTEDDDVWFSFTATNNIHIIKLLNIVGTTTDLNHSLYVGDDCGNLTQVYCSNPDTSVATGLIPNTVYKIRVYTNGSNATQSARFDVCVGTPPPPATNDDCANVITIPVNQTSACVVTTPGNLIGATPSTGAVNTCVGTEDDDVWFNFIATSTHNFVSLLNVQGTTTNLNHAVYTGTCGNLTLKYCSPANALTSNNNTFVIDQMYWVRVWSNENTPQVVTFDICIKPVSTCESQAPFCGASVADPYIFENTTGLPNAMQVACLGSIPNPTFYTLHVGQTGPLNFTMFQNTNIGPNGELLGTNLDVDFVAWGPFETKEESCDEIQMVDCPTCPFTNVGSTFYPFGNIVDCSYSGSFTETLTIPNAQEDEYYVILITNFNGSAGEISLVQNNFGQPGAGSTICCDVDLGDDIVVCATNATLNALEDIEDLENVPNPGSYQWFFNDSATPIPGENNATLTITQSGLYKVTASCGVNNVEDTINVILGPVITPTTPAPYAVCDDVTNDGFAAFDLLTLNSQVLGTLPSTDYTITYHVLESDANLDNGPAIDTATLYTNVVQYTQTIYVRIESVVLATCYSVVPVDLVVTPIATTGFDYDADQYCKFGADPILTYVGGGIAGVFSATPNGLSINPTTGAINLEASVPGIYDVSNTIAASGGCAEVKTTVTIEISVVGIADFNYPLDEYCNNGTTSPVFTNGGFAGTFTAAPAGLSINATTGEINLANSSEGTYTISNTIPGDGVCSGDVKTDVITIIEAASATISYNDPFCLSTTDIQNVILTGDTGGNFTSTTGLSINVTTGAINPNLSTAGDYTITYTIPAQGSCAEFSTTATVTIIPASQIDFAQGCESNSYRLVANPANGSFDPLTASYSWSGPNAMSFESTADANAIVLKTAGTFTVTVTTSEGCVVSESITVNNISCVIQRGISPNNNGENDNFDLSSLNVKELNIFNRYGTEVYSYKNYVNQWVGQTNSGDELPDGTYFYVIHTQEGENITGWIYINR